jgi:hypothetical protein
MHARHRSTNVHPLARAHLLTLLALALWSAPAGAAAGGPAEAPQLEISCPEGRVTLDARATPAPALFGALATKCGLALERSELIPALPVTLALRDASLEQAVREIVRLTGIPSTLAATAPGQPMTLVFLPTGTGEVSRPVPEPSPADAGAADGKDGSGTGGARQRPKTEQELLLARIKEIDGDEAWVLKGIDLEGLLQLRAKAATQAALGDYYAAKTDEERARILEALRGIGPAPGTGEPWDAEAVADQRWRFDWRQAEREFLTAADDDARERALARLARLNSDVSGDLTAMKPADLETERKRAALALLRDRYLLSLTPQEWQALYEARRQPPAAKTAPVEP